MKSNNESTSGHSTSLLALNGARVAPTEMDEELITQFSGRDKFSVRQAFARKQVIMNMVAKLVVLCNILPNFKGGHGILRRVEILPFLSQFVDNPTLPHHRPIDIHILDKMNNPACRNAFLHFLIQGCVRAINNHAAFNNLPPEVVEANENFRFDNDSIAPFLATLNRDGSWPAHDLFDMYKSSCTGLPSHH